MKQIQLKLDIPGYGMCWAAVLVPFQSKERAHRVLEEIASTNQPITIIDHAVVEFFNQGDNETQTKDV